MSASSRPLVTIDDPVTIIEPHRVLLERVDEVHREYFHTLSGTHVYRHNDEGTTWARGHHLPDSDVVVALYAAVSLAPPKPEPKMAAHPNDSAVVDRFLDEVGIGGHVGIVSGGLTPDPRDPALIELVRKSWEEAEKNAKKKSWWTTVFGV